MCGGVTGPAWALPVPVPGSVSGLGHGWRHRRKPWSPGGLPEYYFFFQELRNNPPSLEETRAGSLPGVARVVAAGFGGIGGAEGGPEIRDGDGDGCQGFCCGL